MTSTHEGHLDIPNLPPQATRTHIVDDMTTHNLLSVGQLCDAGCNVTIDKDTIDITHHNKTIITGHRSPDTRLWHTDLTPSPADITPTMEIHPFFANASTIGTNTPADVVNFMHGAFFSPTISTLTKAFAKGYIPHIPGFNATTLKKHPPRSAATIKGHLDQTRKNIKSTKPILDETEDEMYPLQLTMDDNVAPNQTNHCFATVFSNSGKMYSDQTGNFFQASSKGNLLIMV